MINALTVKEVLIFPQIYTQSLLLQFCAPDANLEHGNLDSSLCSSGTSYLHAFNTPSVKRGQKYFPGTVMFSPGWVLQAHSHK